MYSLITDYKDINEILETRTGLSWKFGFDT